MIRSNPNGDLPKVDPTAYIDSSAQVIGNVHIGAEVFVGPNAVVRADESDDEGQVHSIEIGAECNIQDGVIIHALGGTSVTIGGRSSLAHGCVVHGPCKLGQECFIGFRAVVYNAALEDGVFVATGGIVQDVDLAANSFVPSGAVVSSSDDVARLVSMTSKADREFSEKVVNANLALTKGYRQLKLPESV